MRPEFSGVEVLRQKFAELQHLASVQEDVLHVLPWGLRVRMRLESLNREGAGTSVSYRAISFLDRLTHPVVDCAIGWGGSLDEANNMAAETYMSSVFPVIHSICCEQCSAYGVENSSLYAMDAESGVVRDWRLIRGPQVLINATPREIPPGVLASILEDEFLQAATRPGTHWFKCFVGRFGAKVEVDCLLNNVELVSGKTRLLEYGRSFPPKDMMTCKQHLLVYPLDPEVITDYREKQQSEWLEPLSGVRRNLDREVVDDVLAGFRALHRLDGLSENMIHDELRSRGISAKTATKLVSFLPAACARDFWGPRGVRFRDQYTLFNFASRRSLTRPLSSDPVFCAGLAVIRAWKAAGVAAEVLGNVLAFSAENNAILEGVSQGARPEHMEMQFLVVPSDEEVDGEINTELLKTLGIRVKPWWKFW